jgi:hypothetical protein
MPVSTRVAMDQHRSGDPLMDQNLDALPIELELSHAKAMALR